jgi:hypothetical protein
MQVGILSLNRFNGQEQFAISEAVMRVSENNDYFNLNFEIETDEKPLKTLSDTKDLYAHPNAEFNVRIKDFSRHSLVGERFTISNGYDEETGEYLTRLYYCEHQETDDNVIEIIDQKENKFRVIITAKCVDVNYYDGSKPPTEIEIDAWFEAQEN